MLFAKLSILMAGCFFSFVATNIAEEKKNTTGEGETIFTYSAQILEKIEHLKDLQPQEFLKEVNEYRKDVELFIINKKKVCNGEYSVLILAEGKSNGNQEHKKLTPEERLFCFRELKAIQVSYINNLYQARKRYLEDIHKKTLDDLFNTRSDIVKEFEDAFIREEQNFRKIKK